MSSRKSTPSTAKVLRVLGDQVLTLLAVGGALCIVLVLLSWIFSISIMMFRTGSMSPTITAGSIAFVREIPAADMEKGDVVTVDRGEDVLPVTHRVVDIIEVDRASGEVTFVMQGDANDVVDPEPYTATEVRRVMFSVPGAARVIQWFGDPMVLGGITLGATALVIWAFWPRNPDTDDPHDERPYASGSPSQRASTLNALGIPLIVALVTATPPVGSTETRLITGEHLRIRTEGSPAQMQGLDPGGSAVWDVGVWADAPEPGEIDLSLTGRGELAERDGALSVSVDACTVPWSASTCPSGAVALLEDESLDDIAAQEGTRHLATMSTDEEHWLRITVVLTEEAGPQGLVGADGDVLLHAVGAGEQLSTGSGGGADGGIPGGDGAPEGDGDLARTGAAGVIQLLALALAALTAGAVLRTVRQQRRAA